MRQDQLNVAEMQQPIQTLNFRRIKFVSLNSTRQKCDIRAQLRKNMQGPYYKDESEVTSIHFLRFSKRLRQRTCYMSLSKAPDITEFFLLDVPGYINQQESHDLQ